MRQQAPGGAAAASCALGWVVEGNQDVHRTSGSISNHEHFNQAVRALGRHRVSSVSHEHSLTDLKSITKFREGQSEQFKVRHGPCVRGTKLLQLT